MTAQAIEEVYQGKSVSLVNGTLKTQDGRSVKAIIIQTMYAVDKGTIVETVLKDGFVTKSAICNGLDTNKITFCQ
jgi:hypothetical protein